MEKTNKKNLFLIGVFATILLFCTMLEANRIIPITYATDWDVSNAVVEITDDTTISEDVNVCENTTLNVAMGKTLTIEGVLNIYSDVTLTINGPGTLQVSNANTLDDCALNISNGGAFVLNDGRVIVSATGNNNYSFFADDDTSITINDGALIVNGGTSAGLKAHNITIKRGLLRVHSTGTDDTKTFGILMDSLVVGVMNNSQYHPTIEVVEPSTNSIGIGNPDYLNDGDFYYYGGSMEITSKTYAIQCHSSDWDNSITYSGDTKETATKSDTDKPYMFVTHKPVNTISQIQVGGYGIMVKNGWDQEMAVINSIDGVATFEGRTSVNEPLTAFDRIIKDLLCTVQYGPYGIVKDLQITGGDANKMTVTNTGVKVSGAFLEPVTISGKYTYFDVVYYAEKPFEITFTTATETESGTTNWGGKMICADDVTVSNLVSVSGDADLFIPAGKTLTLSSGLRIKDSKTLRVYGPGKLQLIKDGVNSSDAALKLLNASNFILNDGYVDAVATGKCNYCVQAGNNTTITINDGAFIVNGGKSAGIRAHDIDLNRGLLRVHSAGTDGTKTYGILMDSLTVGNSEDFTHRPTLEVVEPSTNSIGISNPNPLSAGSFRYDCGFVEVSANTLAFDCHHTGWYDAKMYKGENKGNASLTGNSNSPYYFVTHEDWFIPYETDYDYCLAFNDERKQDAIYVTPTSKTFSFEGRECVTDDLTDFDQFIKDFFYPILDGPYGILKDIVITDGNGQVVGTDTGFSVNGKYNGVSTISGKYTYFDGEEYQEKEFELGLTVSKGPDLTYEADEDTITATYGILGTYDLTLVAPTTNLVYDSTSKSATITAGYDTDFFPNAVIKYFKGGEVVSSCINAGDYIAKVEYDTAVAEVYFSIAKANPTYTIPTDLTAVLGGTLADVALPDGWSWVDDTQGVGELGNNVFKANFTPTDVNNYNAVENIDVVVAVSNVVVDLDESTCKHGFCIGWIALLLTILEFIAYFFVRLHKNKTLHIVVLAASSIIFVFALTIMLIHNCIVSIVSLVLASVLLAFFALYDFVFKRKQIAETTLNNTKQ